MDLNKPENKEYVDTLELSEVIEKLDSINKEYKEITAERADNQLANKVDSFKIIRVDVDDLYEELSLRAFAENVVNPTEESKTFINSINKLIDDTNHAYKLRKAVKKSKKDKKKSSDKDKEE